MRPLRVFPSFLAPVLLTLNPVFLEQWGNRQPQLLQQRCLLLDFLFVTAELKTATPCVLCLRQGSGGDMVLGLKCKGLNLHRGVGGTMVGISL